MTDQKAVVVALSGCSSSGKTTLARLLRDIFPNTFILHEDDFYRAEEELPSKNGLLDWDCPQAINIPDMEKALAHIRTSGTFPPFVDSKEDQNSVGACPVSTDKIAALQAKVAAWLRPSAPGHAVFASGLRLCLFDGFLLYCSEMQAAMRLIDVKLFLTVSRARATHRREARDGYVTLEGFWKDPPGYVDAVVWPNYADAHGWLFEGRHVEGALDRRVLRENGILAQEGDELDVDMEKTLEWAVDTVMAELERRLKPVAVDA
ncbi:conserved hypothetical protein [Verticillium alfalfae VaMs.102]|uniref:Nicotinamide riboside kinase n=1 Tax=Verticillium alfalfae (strain VaMs.102 / ATCC MYA-4576 / FGSC 10136) TaxID=526221 RepID=C9SAP4_VERA1|nr:conserved hypothetical protein [Verticillium alfalfae VaMs.102]EEY15492.1 conserved hypothetical protein [Verticillium alfalfae VaMs.102]